MDSGDIWSLDVFQPRWGPRRRPPPLPRLPQWEHFGWPRLSLLCGSRAPLCACAAISTLFDKLAGEFTLAEVMVEEEFLQTVSGRNTVLVTL